MWRAHWRIRWEQPGGLFVWGDLLSPGADLPDLVNAHKKSLCRFADIDAAREGEKKLINRTGH